ncbi:MAG: hypothetical protein SWH68_01050 [Thermodesulfobacteriota bacterium]|nr:hypothetical protein [Thermodesulfobacteriota bacterium]
MTIARYHITPLSSLSTPLMSDTIFGHFCWFLYYCKGESFLQDFLGQYGNGKAAPVLFSSAFPAGRLPRPALPPLTRKQARQFVADKFETNSDLPDHIKNLSGRHKRLIGMNALKSWQKHQFMGIEDFTALQNDFRETDLYERLFWQYRQNNGKMDNNGDGTNEVSAGNSISRITGTVNRESGGLYTREKTWFPPDTHLDLYVTATSEENHSDVDRFLTEFLPSYGFGKDKSVGMGHLQVARDEAFQAEIFNCKTANARMALSLTAFTGMGEHETFYHLTTKFGKLGGDFAFSSPTGGPPRPFKKPLLMMMPGAVFMTSEPLDRHALVDNIHSDSRIKHCGIPLTVPLNIQEAG